MTILGLEHEYEVRCDGRPIDFRTLIADVAASGCRLDPVDPYAHRMPNGSVLTCDGAEAETAAPPIELRPGFTAQMTSWAASMLVPLTGYDLHGVSTHISVEVRDDLTLLTCGLFARRFAPALMLLGDGPHGLGLLVRPRHRRVELGLGFTAGGWLRAATALASGGVLACADVAGGLAARRDLPPRVRARFEGARARFGWYVDRRAFGVDLYDQGRDARLRIGAASRQRAQRSLEAAWQVARDRLDHWGLASASDLEDADRLVAGTTRLHSQCKQARLPATMHRGSSSMQLQPAARHCRAAFDVVPVAATWDFTVFAVEGARTLYLSVPRVEHDQFFGDLTAGRLDGGLARALSLPTAGRVLSTYADAHRGGQFDEVRLGALRVPERAYDGSFV